MKHFRECGVDNYTITGLEKLRDRDPHIRKAREKYYKELFQVKIKWYPGKGTIYTIRTKIYLCTFFILVNTTVNWILRVDKEIARNMFSQ